MSAGRGPRTLAIRRAITTAAVVLLSLGTTTALGLTGTHQVIVAYYPIFPRWYTTQSCLWIGDPIHQYPLLGLYDNKYDAEVVAFDFGCMKNMGATAVNPHFFGTTVDTDRCNRIDGAAASVDLMWTPTFEAFTRDPVALANLTNAFLAIYGASPNLMKVDNRPVMFWHLHGENVTESSIAEAVEIVRACSGEVMIILDSIGLGQCCQWVGDGNGDTSPFFMEPDNTTGYQRINGFYSWVPAYWCMFSPSTRRTYVNNYVNQCINDGMIPVLSTSPSDNEENWGYECDDGRPPTENCGVGGQRCYNPYYNPTRDVTEWESNLNDLLYNNHPDNWIYIQAWDEWAEGSALAPNTCNCFDFLAKFKQVLYDKNWLTENSDYCRPGYPTGYQPSECSATPQCPIVPIICRPGPGSVRIMVGIEYTEQISLCNVTDPAPTFSIVSGPSGLQINNSGYVFGWIPTCEQLNQTFTIIARAENPDGYDEITWQASVAITADFDDDGDVDLQDFGHLQSCYSGSSVPFASGCSDADIDRDGDVDHIDFLRFKPYLSGATHPYGC